MTSKPLASNRRVNRSSASPSSWMTSTVGRANDKVAPIIAGRVFRHMRWMLPLGVLAGFAACAGGGAGKVAPPPLPPAPGLAEKIDLPSIPAKIEVKTSTPTDADAPDQRSPILDEL